MKVIEKSVYNFSKNNPPVETAEPGEILMFKTMDCFSNKITSEDIPIAMQSAKARKISACAEENVKAVVATPYKKAEE